MQVHRPWNVDEAKEMNDHTAFDYQLRVLDGMIGELWEKVAASGIAEDTIFLLTGDHGEDWVKSKRPNYPDWAGLQVPLVLHIPDQFLTAEAKENLLYNLDKPSSILDIFWTLADLAGIEVDF